MLNEWNKIIYTTLPTSMFVFILIGRIKEKGNQRWREEWESKVIERTGVCGWREGL